jgi:peroxiredoxin
MQFTLDSGSGCREMSTELARDILPELKAEGHRLFLVSIGTTEMGHKFAQKTKFPEELLFADEENATYDALGLHQGLGVTYISPLVRTRISEHNLDNM